MENYIMGVFVSKFHEMFPLKNTLIICNSIDSYWVVYFETIPFVNFWLKRLDYNYYYFYHTVFFK